jgi:ABC-type phosphate transport system permease subunit
MPSVVYEFHGIFSIVIFVLDIVAALVGFSIVNPVRCPSDVSGQVCGSSGGDDLPSVGYKILEEEISAGHFGFADRIWADGPDAP